MSTAFTRDKTAYQQPSGSQHCCFNLLQGVRPHIFGMTASPVNTRAKQTQMKVAEAVWQLERNVDAQVITVIDRDPVTAAAPLPELKLLYYVRQHTSDSLKEVEGEIYHVGWCRSCQQGMELLWVLFCFCGMLLKTHIPKPNEQMSLIVCFASKSRVVPE